MKRRNLLLWVAAAVFAVGCYDDSALVSRVDALEDDVNSLNALSERLSDLEDDIFVTSVTEIKDDAQNVLGLSFALNEGEPVVVYYGNGVIVNYTDSDVTFTLPDNVVVTLPRVGFRLTLAQTGDIAVLHGGQTTVNYRIDGATDDTMVYLLPDNGWTASLGDNNTIVVTAPGYGSLSGKVVVLAGNSENAAMAVLSFEEGAVSISENEFSIVKEGGNVEIPVAANLEYDVVIPEDASWLSYVETKAMRNETVVLSAAANESYPRNAKVELKVGDKTFCTFKVSQAGAIEPSYTADDLIGTWIVTCTNGSSPATFDLSIVKSDDSAKGDVILKRWFKPNSTTETTIYALVDNIANTLTILPQLLPHSGYYGGWTAAQNSTGTIYTVVFTIENDGAKMTIDEDMKLGDTWYEGSGNFTTYYYYDFELNKTNE